MNLMDLDKLKTELASVAESEELRLVVLFGSGARGEHVPRDLDIAVRGDRPLDVIGLTNRLTVELGRQDVDLVDLRVADPVVLMKVAEEGIVLYEAEPGTFGRFQSLAARRYFDTRKFREAEREEIREFVRRRRDVS